MALALLKANRPKLEGIRAAALVRMGKITALESQAKGAIEASKSRMLAASGEYDKAYDNYAKVIGKAKKEAQNQEMWTEIFVGIAIGVLIGLAVEAAAAGLAVRAAAAGASALVKGLSKGAKAAGGAVKEAVGESGEAAAGKGAGAAGLTKVAGSDLEPGGLKPEVLRMGVWKSLTQLHQSVPSLASASLDQGLLMSNAEYVIGEIKAHVSGGSGADMTEDEVAQMAVDVINAEAASKALDKKIDDATKAFQALKSAAEQPSDYDATKMEKDIWRLWMASLKEADSDILDLDEIEDYIGPEGLGLIDFGRWTSKDDEVAAIRQARGEASTIRKRLRDETSVGGVQPMTVGEGEASR